MRTSAPWFAAPRTRCPVCPGRASPSTLRAAADAALTGPPAQEPTLSIGCKDESGPATDHADDNRQPSRPCRAGGGATVGVFPIPPRGRSHKIDART